MPIRKGKMRKLCVKCGEMFEPYSKFSKNCDDCLAMIHHPILKYYKFVRRCQRCKKVYGTDYNQEKDNQLCGECIIYPNGKLRKAWRKYI